MPATSESTVRYVRAVRLGFGIGFGSSDHQRCDGPDLPPSPGRRSALCCAPIARRHIITAADTESAPQQRPLLISNKSEDARAGFSKTASSSAGSPAGSSSWFFLLQVGDRVCVCARAFRYSTVVRRFRTSRSNKYPYRSQVPPLPNPSLSSQHILQRAARRPSFVFEGPCLSQVKGKQIKA